MDPDRLLPFGSSLSGLIVCFHDQIYSEVNLDIYSRRKNMSKFYWQKNVHSDRERSGSVVECLTRDRRAAGSSLTGVTALWSLSKTHLS